MAAESKYCTRCGRGAEIADVFCRGCGTAFPGMQPGSVTGAKPQDGPYVAPPPESVRQGLVPQSQYPGPYGVPGQWNPAAPPAAPDGPLAGIFPYKNSKALLAYYLGVFSIALWILAIPALILGVLGLRAFQEDPRIRGAGHAWTGIILGSLVILGGIVLIISIFAPVYSQ